MISFRPLRIYCMDNKIKLSHVIKACKLSMKFVTKINNDENIELKSLDKICLYLDIPVEQAVAFVKE